MNIMGSMLSTAKSRVGLLRRQNRTLRDARDPLWLRSIDRLIADRSIFILLAAYAGLFTCLVVAGAFLSIDVPTRVGPLFAGASTPSALGSILSYMLGAQATMVGLIFPLALGMVTLIVQRDEGASTNVDVQLYYDQSRAYAVGTSGIALATVLLAALWAPEALVLALLDRSQTSDSISLALTLALSGWLFVNLLVTWQFLITSLSFIRPRYRAACRRRFVATRVIPSHSVGLLSANAYAHIDTRYFAGSEARPLPFVMGSAATGMSGEPEVSRTFDDRRVLHDIWLLPLQAAIHLWAWRSRRAGKGPGEDKFKWMVGIAGPFGQSVKGEIILCRRVGGVALSPVERLLVRSAFRFSPPQDERDLGPSEILEELVDRVVVQIDRDAVTAFGHALQELTDFHSFLLAAHNIVEPDGITRSLAAYGYWAAEHSVWLKQYGRLYERAAAAMVREDSFIGTLAYVLPTLIPARSDRMPPDVVAALFELEAYMVHRLGHWLADQRGPRGTGIAALVPGPLPPNVAKAYRTAILKIVGGWEDGLRLGARYAVPRPGATEAEAWATVGEGWPIIFTHLRTSAYLVVAAHWHEDDIAAPLYREAFLRWRDTLGDVGDPDVGHGRWRSDLILSDLVEREWPDVVRAMLPLARFAHGAQPAPAVVGAVIFANLYADVRVVTSLVLLGWASSSPTIYGASASVAQLLDGSSHAGGMGPPAGIDVMTIVQSFLRLKVAGWASDKSDYLEEMHKLVQSLDGMRDKERVAGRAYSVETRFRVEDLTDAWFAIVAAHGEQADLDAVAGWLGDLGDDEQASRLDDAVLRQLCDWLRRRTEAWVEPGSHVALLHLIEVAQPKSSAEAAGDSLVAAFNSAIDAISTHRRRRLAAMPISDTARDEITRRAGEALLALPDRIGMFPAVAVSVIPRRKATKPLAWSGVDKAELVSPAMASHPEFIPKRMANAAAARGAGKVWEGYLKRPRQKIVVRSPEAFFEAARSAAAPILSRGAIPICLLPTAGPAWVESLNPFEVGRLLGPDAARREGVAQKGYSFSYAGIDFYRSALKQGEILGDDMLQAITLLGTDGGQPASTVITCDATTLECRIELSFDVEAIWAPHEGVALVPRATGRSRAGK